MLAWRVAITRTSVARETTRRMARFDLHLGSEIRRLRLDAGLSLTALGQVVGVHRSHLARIEAGTARASLELLHAIAVALGAELSVRYFAGIGPRLHDRTQAVMVESLLRTLDRRWRVELEVPLGRPSRGVADLLLSDTSTPTTVIGEVQSQLRRLEQQVRWMMDKAEALAERLRQERPDRAHVPASRLLILRSTEQTRDLARQFEASLSAAYPAPAAEVVAALTTPTHPWPGPGIVWMRVDHGTAVLLPNPPRGVRLGR